MAKVKTKNEIAAKRRKIERAIKGYGFPNFDILENPEDANWRREFIYAFNYANAIFDNKELKAYTLEYCPGAEGLNKAPDWEFFHIGIVAWLGTKAVPLPKDTLKRFDEKVSFLIKKYKPVEKMEKLDAKTLKTNKALEDLEGVLDDVSTKSPNTRRPLGILQENAGADVDAIQKHFQDILDEMTDPELKDSFRDTTRIQQAVKIILADIEALKTNKVPRKARKPRAPKKINPSKMVRKLKYLPSFKELNLTSMQPEKMIGAEILWVYNTKTRQLGKYVAKDATGLLLKGSTLLNFDEKESVSKKLRKPEVTLNELSTAGKVSQRKLLDGIKAKANVLKGRINKDTILVKVY